MNSDRKIKGFNEFMNNSRLHKSLDMTVISGVIKTGFFSKKKKFELFIYHTPIKHKVVSHKILGTTLSELNINIKLGDNIDDFRNWAIEKGYEIEEFVR